jgi:hypothetical protein
MNKIFCLPNIWKTCVLHVQFTIYTNKNKKIKRGENKKGKRGEIWPFFHALYGQENMKTCIALGKLDSF